MEQRPAPDRASAVHRAAQVLQHLQPHSKKRPKESPRLPAIRFRRLLGTLPARRECSQPRNQPSNPEKSRARPSHELTPQTTRRNPARGDPAGRNEAGRNPALGHQSQSLQDPSQPSQSEVFKPRPGPSPNPISPNKNAGCLNVSAPGNMGKRPCDSKTVRRKSPRTIRVSIWEAQVPPWSPVASKTSCALLL